MTADISFVLNPTLVLSLNVMCLSHLGGFQACYFWEANDRNPDLFTIN